VVWDQEVAGSNPAVLTRNTGLVKLLTNPVFSVPGHGCSLAGESPD